MCGIEKFGGGGGGIDLCNVPSHVDEAVFCGGEPLV